MDFCSMVSDFRTPNDKLIHEKNYDVTFQMWHHWSQVKGGYSQSNNLITRLVTECPCNLSLIDNVTFRMWRNRKI